jgi:release factor glutamine methyltransferase
MSQANLYAGLIGVLAVEVQRRALPAGQVNAMARELWHAVAGIDPPPESKTPIPLTVLNPGAPERLRARVAERFSARVAALLPADGTVPGSHTAASRQAPDATVPAAQAGLFQELLADTAGKLNVLHDKPEETADSTLRALWLVAAGAPMSAEQAAEAALPSLDAAAVARLRALLAERLAGTPLAHLTGRQRFMGMELMASKAALVPRKETELLGHVALVVLRQLASAQETLRVIDVCTGAGNLALALATHEPKARVYASDLSTEAVELARRNGTLLGLGSRVEFRQGDFLNPFADGNFDRNVDLLVCNPPYISSGKVATLPTEIIGHEPSLAFDGGPFGVKILQRLLSEAPQYLRPGGWLAFEVGLGQGPALMDRMRRNSAYADLAAVVDAAGAVRAVVARLQ